MSDYLFTGLGHQMIHIGSLYSGFT